MRAVTIEPGTPESLRMEDVAEPASTDGAVLVETIAVGICGTDREMIAGGHGQAPPGRDRLVLGHESLGRVLDAPAGSGFVAGDLVVGMVRRPDPVPCINCAVGEWDMCRNGLYTEHGIKAIDGFARERFRLDPTGLIGVDPALGDLGVLLEPTSIVAKAWEHITHIGRRARWEPRRVLVTGAGPIGLLAALLARQRDLDVTVLDRIETGAKPELVAALGASYHVGSVADVAKDADVVIEATGAAPLVFDVMQHNPPNAVVCLTGVTSAGRALDIAGGLIARRLVLENDVVFGSVNANRRHYEQAADALEAADGSWLDRLVTRRVPLDDWRDAYARRTDDIKTVLTFGAAVASRVGGRTNAGTDRGSHDELAPRTGR